MNVTPDGRGGIRFLWRRNDREVRLAISRAGLDRGHIYWQNGEDYGGDEGVSVDDVMDRLRSLAQQ